MNFDKAPEIIVTPEELQVNAEGKKYAIEEDGVFYGGDYLPKPPAEINIDESFPPAPAHEEHPAL